MVTKHPRFPVMRGCISFIIILYLMCDFHARTRVLKNVLKRNESTASTPLMTQKKQEYIPANVEQYLLDHAGELGYTSTEDPSGCGIWKTEKEDDSDFKIDPSIRKALSSYRDNLQDHTQAIQSFEPIPDLLKSIRTTGNHDVCATARPHPDGLQALFPSQELSMTTSGYVEPLTPPMRDPNLCLGVEGTIMSLNYLVHDFEAMCRNLKPTSRRILIDLGASLEFADNTSPIFRLIETYEKFGFNFDHIYGFEINFTEPKDVFETLLPEKYFSNYHWMNVGVSHEEGHRLNPLHSILKGFEEDDFIVLKLDIDTNDIEQNLARQLLVDKDDVYHKLIDHFYFEDHVHIREMKPAWGCCGAHMEGTIKDTQDLFYGLREKGIPAHFWP